MPQDKCKFSLFPKEGIQKGLPEGSPSCEEYVVEAKLYKAYAFLALA